MSARTFTKALTLIYGVLLAPGRRTICSALRVQGLSEEKNFGKYHRVLHRDRWSAMQMSHLLLGLLIEAFVPEGVALVFLIDETLERRCGKKIVYKGWFRDAVRSVGNKVAVSLGIRWCCVCLLVSVPWSSRPWALPFLAVPVLSEKTCQRLKKRHRSGVEWAAFLMQTIRFWQPERAMILVGDGGYAAVELVGVCQRLEVALISRLRLDAGLYDFAGPQPASKPGPKPQKGARQPNLKQRLLDPRTEWQPLVLTWYGGQEKRVEYVSEICLWYTPRKPPVPLRWVLVRYEEVNQRTGKKTTKAAAFFCSGLHLLPLQILTYFIGRWNIEVTFEEIRAHLGFETQRHWSRRAVGRTTPCLLGLFSVAVLIAKTLHPQSLPLQQSGWYTKEEATFSDVLAAVRLHLWGSRNNAYSPLNEQMCLIPAELWKHLQGVAAYAH